MKWESKFVDSCGYFAVLYFSLPFELIQGKKVKKRNRKIKEKKYVWVLNCECYLIYYVQWNTLNTITNRPKKFDRINGLGVLTRVFFFLNKKMYGGLC